MEDADDDTSLERNSTVDRQDAQKHLDRCEAEHTAAMKARSDAVAHLAELMNALHLLIVDATTLRRVLYRYGEAFVPHRHGQRDCSKSSHKILW